MDCIRKWSPIACGPSQISGMLCESLEGCLCFRAGSGSEKRYSRKVMRLSGYLVRRLELAAPHQEMDELSRRHKWKWPPSSVLHRCRSVKAIAPQAHEWRSRFFRSDVRQQDVMLAFARKQAILHHIRNQPADHRT